MITALISLLLFTAAPPVTEASHGSYHHAVASWYGPGLYGNTMACGGKLRPSTIGVAHKYLPCGTKLRLAYHGRRVDVRVRDRGPYVAGREFDMTYATRRALHFPNGVRTILWKRR